MRKGPRGSIVSSFALLGVLCLAPLPSAAEPAPQPGCWGPNGAAAEYADAWLGSFMNNGIGGFPKLCEKLCKTGSKGCDRVVRSAVSCGEDSIDALLGVDAIQCRELPEPDRTACLQSVADTAAQGLADVAAAGAAAAGTCAGALQECLSFCAGSI